MAKNQKKTRKQESKITLQWIATVAIVVIMVVVTTLVIINQNNKQQEAEALDLANTSVAGELQKVKRYAAEPAMTIDPAGKYLATFKLAKGGEFTVELFADKAPRTVNSFVFLAREKYFDGTTFHRVLEGFMAQGGDPTGTGMGGPGYQFPNEDSDLVFDQPGVLAMANAGRDTNGSQFFITFVPTPQLNGGYTIFGRVAGGMDVVNGITRRDPQQYPDYTGDVIESVTITEE